MHQLKRSGLGSSSIIQAQPLFLMVTADPPQIVSACVEDDTGRVSYKIGFDNCVPAANKKINWVATQVGFGQQGGFGWRNSLG